MAVHATTTNYNDVKKCYKDRVEVECECPKVTDKTWEDKKCIDKDVCLNLDGDNETIPTGYQADDKGVCTLIPPVVTPVPPVAQPLTTPTPVTPPPAAPVTELPAGAK